jgi:hypothetical protein
MSRNDLTPPPSACPSSEDLFDAVLAEEGEAFEHSLECEACAMVLEEHRQLEKDLYRLVDPLPPVDLVRNVMARVDAAPAPLRRELSTGLGILAATLALGLGVVARDPQVLAELGLALSSLLVNGHHVLPTFVSALSTTWAAVGVMGVAVCTSLLFVSLLGLKRLSGGPATVSEAL